MTDDAKAQVPRARAGSPAPRPTPRHSVASQPAALGSHVLPAAIQYFDTRTLFAGQREIAIGHDGAVYRLRITQQNKLILTK